MLQISTEATQELALEELLAKVHSKWSDVEFVVMPYKEVKDTFILGGIEEVQVRRLGWIYRSEQPSPLTAILLRPHPLSVTHPQVALEDSMVTMSTILASRFVGGIRAEVEKVEKQLNLFAEVLDEWINVQKTWWGVQGGGREVDGGRGVRWRGLGSISYRRLLNSLQFCPVLSPCRMYLEPIFSAPDIQRQLPVEAKQFFHTDKQYKEVMRRAKDRPNALLAGTAPGLLEVRGGRGDRVRWR